MQVVDSCSMYRVKVARKLRRYALYIRLALGLFGVVSVALTGRSASAGTLLNFNTNMGSYQVDLFDDVPPATVNNFLQYVNSSAYTNTLIHRTLQVGTD